MCLAFVRRRFPHGSNILCGKEATHRVVGYGPGRRVPHAAHCKQHAARLAKRFAQPPGWTIQLDPLPDPLR